MHQNNYVERRGFRYTAAQPRRAFLLDTPKRRGSELAGDLSLVAEVAKLPGGPTTITGSGLLTAHLTDAAHYGITLLLATGSDPHIVGLRALAAERKRSRAI